MGANGVAALAEAQANIQQLANSLANAHAKIDALEAKLKSSYWLRSLFT
jgi:multidrug resistance efflux pump